MVISQVLMSADAPAPTAAPLLTTPARGRYSLLVTRDGGLVRNAQRLRHDVFAVEQGARLTPGPAAREGRDADAFDPFCDHLVVREDATGQVVGTYRMLSPEGASRAGGLYSDTEFDLAALDDLRPRTVEVGRACVHPDHRSGTVLSLVWAGIGRYLLLTGHRWLVGCASVPLTTDGALPDSVWSLVSGGHLTTPDRRVTPRRPAPIGEDPTVDHRADARAHDAEGPPRRASRSELPHLLRAYLRLGARIAGPPALDTDFGVADLFVLLDHTAIDPRWRRHLLGDGG